MAKTLFANTVLRHRSGSHGPGRTRVQPRCNRLVVTGEDTYAMTESERLERILDGIGDYIVNASDEDLLEAARNEGRNPAETAVRVKRILLDAVKAFQTRGST